MNVGSSNKLGSFSSADDNFYIYYNIFPITILSGDIFACILNICDSV